jgi:hypothetical protein
MIKRLIYQEFPEIEFFSQIQRYQNRKREEDYQSEKEMGADK